MVMMVIATIATAVATASCKITTSLVTKIRQKRLTAIFVNLCGLCPRAVISLIVLL